MPSEHLRVVPVRIPLEDTDLRTTRLRGVGFRATNGTDWTGPTRKVRQDAVEDMKQRKAHTPAPRIA